MDKYTFSRFIEEVREILYIEAYATEMSIISSRIKNKYFMNKNNISTSLKSIFLC